MGIWLLFTKLVVNVNSAVLFTNIVIIFFYYEPCCHKEINLQIRQFTDLQLAWRT